ncbi:hypothetical protein DKT77_07295 [Meridianimarinicoccus roseus]|uniref:Uncharacterized protein n=1 Tax=Meridianimarinicoccus roseus TaxID=2072018 RepID=A0A2V2LNI7_9RHOB|nr:hypothetical protein [Meridianimarinicoccus roseus]PWR03263.1 hypothetical protein DKT77_07295 [Meridianimarinicoccus roseus]
MVEITDEKGARAWLEMQPKQVCVAMAARIALRGLAALGAADGETSERLVLVVFRAVLVAGASATSPVAQESRLRSAARRAVNADFSGARPAMSAGAISHYAARVAAGMNPTKSITRAISSAVTLEASDPNPTPVISVGSRAVPDAFSAFNQDAVASVEAAESPELLFNEPVWRSVDEPEGLAKGRTSLLRFLDADPAKWDFWARWYRGMFDGQPMDWALQRDVALIPDGVWQAGPAEVAKRVAEIENQFAPIPPEAARAQAQVLLLRPQITVLQANGLRELIDRAVDEYRREVCNQLPDCLQPLENLPVILHQIAETADGDAPMTEKEAALMRILPLMARTISYLNRRLQAAHADKATGDPDKRRLFHDAFYGRLGERSAELITSKTLWGGLLLGATVLLGSSVENVQAGLSTCYESIIKPEAGQERFPPPPPHFPDPFDEA